MLAALERGAIDLAPLTGGFTEIPRLDPDQAVPPITDLDELYAVLGRLLEKVDDPDEFERVLDGLSRLCNQRPPDFDARTKPLRRRVEKRRLSNLGYRYCSVGGAAHQVSNLVADWLAVAPAEMLVGQELVSLPATAKGVPGLPAFLIFQCWRLSEIGARLRARIAAPVLAAPTHRGSWIDPRVFVDRLAEYLARGRDIGEYDAVAALLRLAPDHRAEALERARTLTVPDRLAGKLAGQFLPALRYALGGEAAIGPPASFWVAAARSRSAPTDDPRIEAAFPGFGPDAGIRAVVELTFQTGPRSNAERGLNPVQLHITPEPPDDVPVIYPTVLYYRPEDRYPSFWAGGLPWVLTMRPLDREPLFLKGLVWMADYQKGKRINRERRQFLEPFLDPDVPLGPYATLLLAFGLTAPDAGVAGMAVEVLLTAAADGRLDPEHLGGAIIRVATAGSGKYARWAKALAEAARPSPLHAEAIRQVIERVLQGDAAAVAREVGPLVELLLELCVQCGRGVTAEATRTFLAGLPGGGKVAKAARRLVDWSAGEDKAKAHAIQALAVEYRLIRAERWTRRRR